MAEAPMQQQYVRHEPQDSFDPENTTNAELIKGIIHHGRELLGSELALAKSDLQRELQRARKTATLASFAGGMAGVGAVLLGFCSAYALELTGLALWACLGVIGVALMLAAACLGLVALKKGKRMDVSPRELVADAERVFNTIGQRAHDSLKRELDAPATPSTRGQGKMFLYPSAAGMGGSSAMVSSKGER